MAAETKVGEKLPVYKRYRVHSPKYGSYNVIATSEKEALDYLNRGILAPPNVQLHEGAGAEVQLLKNI